eukprot:TRINITY_DN7571_c0_g1_i1.p1 TRINITY_DN7571_c0_g1~~TRINITY_DN7571_c0_g1_i1.p1  ORF type:complete len:110 (-),score=13.29 TRINITY_DN7571_c0_g1_i1:60-389(-)
MTNWDIELFDCFSDIKVCLISCFLAPCQLAVQANAIEGKEDIMHWVLACCCSFCCAVVVRGRIREKYNIDGDLLRDVVTVCYCACCVITQQTRELDARGLKPAGLFMQA